MKTNKINEEEKEEPIQKFLLDLTCNNCRYEIKKLLSLFDLSEKTGKTGRIVIKLQTTPAFDTHIIVDRDSMKNAIDSNKTAVQDRKLAEINDAKEKICIIDEFIAEAKV